MSDAFCAVVLSATATLFDELGSATADVAVTVLVHTPGVGRMTWIVTVALARNASVPSEQLTTPPTGALHVPCVVAALTNVDPAGSVSANEMPVAVSGPLFSTRMVYVNVPRAGPGSGLSDWLTTRSACCASAGIATADNAASAMSAASFCARANARTPYDRIIDGHGQRARSRRAQCMYRKLRACRYPVPLYKTACITLY